MSSSLTMASARCPRSGSSTAPRHWEGTALLCVCSPTPPSPHVQVHAEHPFTMEVGGERHTVTYVPGESNTYVFGGNSNWRGPIWLPGEHLRGEGVGSGVRGVVKDEWEGRDVA